MSQQPVFADLSGSPIYLTGGAQGIGEAMVRAFAAQNANVHFCDIDETRGAALAAELGSCVNFERVDLREPSEIERWIHSADSIQVLINNAANDPRIPLADLTVSAWDELIALNLRSHMLTTQAALTKFQNPASVISFSSITFHLGPTEMAAYVASKGGILAMSRALARELGPKGIRVNTISPGWIMTERQVEEYVTEDVRALLRERQCQPTLLKPEEIANVALFLASETSSAITGQEILADRGWYFS